VGATHRARVTLSGGRDRTSPPSSPQIHHAGNARDTKHPSVTGLCNNPCPFVSSMPAQGQYPRRSEEHRETLACSQEETTASTLESVRPTILDYPALRLVPVGRSLSSGQTRDSRRLASGGISTLLEVAIASTCWPTENYCRNSGTHPPPGRRECDLGSTQDPTPRGLSRSGLVALRHPGP
jgi:hypothetical protein